jgi:tetratricopeptide (TPR) repeat protein
MEIKQQGERIKRSYQVISVFPFVDGVLYYTTYDSFDPEETPTRFIHAIQLQPVPDENTIAKLPLRNENIFVPLQEVFVEDGILYQVFEKMEGNLLGIYLYQNAPLALGEIAEITQTISDHLMECESQGEFALIDPQNMVIEEGKIRFLYGGPLSVFPTANAYSEAELAKQLAELLFVMLTRENLEDHKNKLRPLRSLRDDTPVELESWIMKSISPEPAMRPPLHELWKWAHSFGSKKPKGIEQLSESHKKSGKSIVEKLMTSKKSVLDSFGVKDLKNAQGKVGEQKPKKKLPAWVTWVAIGLLALIFLAQLLSKPGPDTASLIDAKIIQEVEQDEKNAANLYNQSVKAYESGDMAKALTFAKQALAFDPETKQYYVHLANLYGLQKDYKSGITVMNAATVYFTDDAKLFDQLAVFQYYVRDYQKAKEAIDTAVQLNNNLASVHYHRGKIYNILKDSNTAISSMKNAVLKDPKKALYFHDFALIQLQANNVKAAVENEKKAVQLDAKNVDYRITLGLLHLRQREELLRNQSLRPEVKKDQLKEILNLAFTQFDEVNDIDDKNAEAYYYKARAYYINGKERPASYTSAIVATQKAISRDPDNALYSYQLGVCYMAVNNKAAAVAAFQQATKLESSNRLYQNALSQAQAMK